MYDLRGKVALVTGCGGKRGIGRAIARRLAAEGADVAVNDLAREIGKEADRPRNEWGGIPALVAEIEQQGRRSVAVTGDVTNATSVDQMVSTVVAQLGKIDILVNNAGAPAGPDRVPVVELDEEAWDLVLDVNVKGTFLCSRAVARHMIERGTGGRIINLSSTAGKKGIARFSAYCASKFAVIGFTESLALELGTHQINVNAICPWLTETERLLGIADGMKPAGTTAEAYREQMITTASESNPLGRLAQPSDVASVAAFLASDEASYLTGIAVNVAGGHVMH